MVVQEAGPGRLVRRARDQRLTATPHCGGRGTLARIGDPFGHGSLRSPPQERKDNSVQYLPLGNTGLYVSRLCLGAMTFADQEGSIGDVIGATGQELAEQMVRVALDAGVNFFDTANVYGGDGTSERMLGKALKGHRDKAVIATKVYEPVVSHA